MSTMRQLCPSYVLLFYLGKGQSPEVQMKIANIKEPSSKCDITYIYFLLPMRSLYLLTVSFYKVIKKTCRGLHQPLICLRNDLQEREYVYARLFNGNWSVLYTQQITFLLLGLQICTKLTTIYFLHLPRKVIYCFVLS